MITRTSEGGLGLWLPAWVRYTERRGIDGGVGLGDELVEGAVCGADVQMAYGERPNPDGLIDEPFTMRELRQLHEAVLGRLPYAADTFCRTILPHQAEVPGRTREGTVGKPA
ncbi:MULTISPECIES: hypothetical protein [unclassified Modestobacter]